MFNWLRRVRVSRINILGVVELEVSPPVPLAHPSPPVAGTPATERAPASPPKQAASLPGGIRLFGTSASSQRKPREMDVFAEGQKIRLDIHSPGAAQWSVRIGRANLESAIQGWDWKHTTEIKVPARASRNPFDVVFKLPTDGSEVIEVQAGKWWIWVKTAHLADALKTLGVGVNKGMTK